MSEANLPNAYIPEIGNMTWRSTAKDGPGRAHPNTESHHWAWFRGLTCVFEPPGASDQRL